VSGLDPAGTEETVRVQHPAASASLDVALSAIRYRCGHPDTTVAQLAEDVAGLLSIVEAARGVHAADGNDTCRGCSHAAVHLAVKAPCPTVVAMAGGADGIRVSPLFPVSVAGG
jgi:hypothetical protein